MPCNSRDVSALVLASTNLKIVVTTVVAMGLKYVLRFPSGIQARPALVTNDFGRERVKNIRPLYLFW